ncbi:MAG: VOC family protein [Candidatus Heimdallarchaeota archaeon]
MKNPRLGVEIPVLNLKEAQKFYESVFGWEPARVMDDPKGGIWYNFNEFTEFHLFQTEKARPKGLNVGIEVDDVRKTLEKVKTAGGQVTKEAFEYSDGDMTGVVGLFKDPTGNELSLMGLPDR